jgi:hypothetical protein
MDVTILRSEVLRILDGGEPFQSLDFVKADRKRGTGGELVQLRGWAKMCNGVHEARPRHPRYNPGSRLGQRGAIKVVNVHNPQNAQHHPMGVHVLLMLSFNGKRIING